jgi:ankyrin repeat protein
MLRSTSHVAASAQSHNLTPRSQVRTHSQRSPMHFSASIGSVPCIEALFKSGANVDAQDSNGITPLMDACKAGHSDAVRYLLKSCDASV